MILSGGEQPPISSALVYVVPSEPSPLGGSHQVRLIVYPPGPRRNTQRKEKIKSPQLTMGDHRAII